MAATSARLLEGTVCQLYGSLSTKKTEFQTVSFKSQVLSWPGQLSSNRFRAGSGSPQKLTHKHRKNTELGVFPERSHASTKTSKSAIQSALSTSNETAPVNSTEVAQPILVAGAGGGVGQLVVAALLERGYSVRALVRTPEKAKAMFGSAIGEQLEIIPADLRFPKNLNSAISGVGSVIVCTGTTAFPSKRWDGDNGPEQTDVVGNKNLLAALPPTVKRIIFVSSVGVTRYNQLPYNILNLFGVLRCKKHAEEMVQASGIPYTIFRPGRLTDGPYTSYDLNTLLQATSGARKSVVVEKGDTLSGEASRILVAEACVQALALPVTIGQVYCLSSTEGDGPGKDPNKWATIFESL